MQASGSALLLYRMAIVWQIAFGFSTVIKLGIMQPATQARKVSYLDCMFVNLIIKELIKLCVEEATYF
jgi:hypothetical protein